MPLPKELRAIRVTYENEYRKGKIMIEKLKMTAGISLVVLLGVIVIGTILTIIGFEIFAIVLACDSVTKLLGNPYMISADVHATYDVFSILWLVISTILGAGSITAVVSV